MTSRNVGESIERSVRYSRVLKENVAARSHVTGSFLVIELQPLGPSARSIVDVSLAAFHYFMQRWTGQSVPIRAVYFRHDRPHDAAEYERLFPCPVHFNHPTNAIVFDRDVMSIPLLTAQPEVASYLESVARTKLRALEGGPSAELATATEAAIREALDEGDVRIATVARKLGTSPRSLQRALVRSGLVYRNLVDQARQSLATPLVTQTDEPIEVIAERVGYAEAKAFRRAFRRWTGQSPNETRRDARRG